MRFKLPALALTVLLCAVAARAHDIKQLDKDIFDRLAARANETVNVTLDANLLKMATAFLPADSDEDSAKLKKLVSGLRSVTVRSFSFKAKGGYTLADVEQIRQQLKSADWSRIVDVHNKEEGSSAEIYILPGHDSANPKPEGLLIISAEDLELTVVHIVGRIDLNDLASLEDLGVPNISKDGHITKESK